MPLPEAGVLSPELQDFILQCMRKDPFARPSAEALLSHDLILKVMSRPPLLTALHGGHPHMLSERCPAAEPQNACSANGPLYVRTKLALQELV